MSKEIIDDLRLQNKRLAEFLKKHVWQRSVYSAYCIECKHEAYRHHPGCKAEQLLSRYK